MSKATIRQYVVQRAQGRCEYCAILQQCDPSHFQVEHVCPKQHGGADEPGNLSLACRHFNLHKGPNLTAIDPLTGAVVPLFDPRKQNWLGHFMIKEGIVVGLTECGRATAALFKMNVLKQVEMRLMSY